MRLREIRESKGLKQNEVALGLHLTPSLYNRYENGTRETPTALLPVMADFFGVTVDELLGRDGGEEKTKTEPRTIEARIVSAGMDRMSQADREFALEMFRRAFASIYDPKEGDENET